MWYAIDRGYPWGWSETISPTAVLLGGGQSQTIPYTLTSPSGTALGSYSYSMGVHDSNHPIDQTTNLAVQVVQQCNLTVQASLATPSAQPALPGDTVNNTLVVTNPNPAGCGTNSYLISRGWPSGWTMTVSNSVAVDPGATVQVPVSLGVSSTATAGSYPYSFTLYNSWADGSGQVELNNTVQVQPASSGQVQASITSTADLANEDGPNFTNGGTTIWLGSANSAIASYTGLRFNNISIPQAAKITSAYLQVETPADEWITLGFDIYGEDNSYPLIFSSVNKPSQQTLTTSKVSHLDNADWVANTPIQLDDISTVVQEIVNRPDWQPGNSLALILKGTAGSWSRKMIYGYDGVVYSPKLIINYQ